jgi:hypothetical protein
MTATWHVRQPPAHTCYTAIDDATVSMVMADQKVPVALE